MVTVLSLKKNKRGLIKILESVIAILIIFSVLLLLAGRIPNEESENLSLLISPILEEIAQDRDLRQSILDVEINNNQEVVEGVLREFLADRIIMPNLGSDVIICEPTVNCFLQEFPGDARDGDIYSEERIFSTTLSGSTGPKKVKIFLWRK
tara:strand:+ start:1315 stop:1767 length:453 start_codon:yes stop_codon:yes gene_type:complete